MEEVCHLYIVNLGKSKQQGNKAGIILNIFNAYQNDIPEIDFIDEEQSIASISIIGNQSIRKLYQILDSAKLEDYFAKRDHEMAISLVLGERDSSESYKYQMENNVDDFYHNIAYDFYIQPLKSNKQEGILDPIGIEVKLKNQFEKLMKILGAEDIYLNALFEKLIMENIYLKNGKKLEKCFKFLVSQNNFKFFKEKFGQFQPCINRTLNCQFYDERSMTEVHENTDCLFKKYECSKCKKIIINLTKQRHQMTCDKNENNLMVNLNGFQYLDQNLDQGELCLTTKNNSAYFDKMLIVQNFPKNRSIFDIKQFMELFGSIQNFSFKTEEKTNVLNFFCKYEKQEDAIYVKSQLENLQLYERQLRIEYHKSKEELEKSRVYIQGLETNSLHLITNHMKNNFGPVKMVKLLKNQPNKRYICYVEFEFMQDAQRVIQQVRNQSKCEIGTYLKFSPYTLEYVETVNQHRNFMENTFPYQQQQQQMQPNCAFFNSDQFGANLNQNNFGGNFLNNNNNKNYNNLNYNQINNNNNFNQLQNQYKSNNSLNPNYNRFYRRRNKNYNNNYNKNYNNQKYKYVVRQQSNSYPSNNTTNNTVNNFGQNNISNNNQNPNIQSNDNTNNNFENVNLLDTDFIDKLRIQSQSLNSTPNGKNNGSDGDSTDIDTNSNH